MPQQIFSIGALIAWLFYKVFPRISRKFAAIEYFAGFLSISSVIAISVSNPWTWSSLAAIAVFLTAWIRFSLLSEQWNTVLKAMPFFLLLAVPDGYLENTEFARWFAENSSSVAGFFLHFVGIDSLSEGKFLATKSGTISVEYFCTPLKLLPTLYAMVSICHASVTTKQFIKMIAWTTFVVYIIANLRVAALGVVVGNKGLFEIVHNQFSKPIILICMFLAVFPYRKIYLNLDLDPYLKR